MSNKYILFITLLVVLLSRHLVGNESWLYGLLGGTSLFQPESNRHSRPMSPDEGKNVIIKGQFKCNGTDYGHVNVTLKDASNLEKPGENLRIGDEGDVHWNWQDASNSFFPYLNISHNCRKSNEYPNCWKSFVLNFTNITFELTGKRRTPTFNFGNKELTEQNDGEKCKIK